jgi:hypothetical protein
MKMLTNKMKRYIITISYKKNNMQTSDNNLKKRTYMNVKAKDLVKGVEKRMNPGKVALDVAMDKTIKNRSKNVASKTT